MYRLVKVLLLVMFTPGLGEGAAFLIDPLNAMSTKFRNDEQQTHTHTQKKRYKY